MREKCTAKITWLTALLLLSCTMAWAQDRVVTGKITSAEDKSAIPGASIVQKGTSNGTASDSDGMFKINVSANATLIFSFIGYKSQEIEVGAQSTVDVVLETDVTALAEVVVVGYGQQEKKDVTGSIAAVSSKDFNRGVISSPQDLLIGKVAGVQITTQSGAPGAGATIRIRGTGSANASNDPLIVIDGFPVDNTGPYSGGTSNTNVGSNSIPGVSNSLALLNPNDIETYTVLKDASATAIYGLRASNGVIIITTKKGKEGKPQVSYNGNVSVSTPMKYIEVLSGDEYRATAQTILTQGTVPGLTAAAVASLGTANTNWQKEIYQNATSHDHNVNVAGSYKGFPYRVSYGYTDQEGILKNTDMVRNSLNINLTPTFLDGDLKVTVSGKGMNIKQNFGNTGAVGAALAFDPTRPVYDGNTRWGGYYTWVGTSQVLADGSRNPNGDPNTQATANPVSLINQTDNRSTAWRGIGNVQIDYRLRAFPAIKFTVNAGLDRTSSSGYNNNPVNTASLFVSDNTTGGQKTNYTTVNFSKLLDVYANYTKLIEDHKIDITAGYSYQNFQRDGSNFTRNSDDTNFKDYQLGADGTTHSPRRYNSNPNTLLSFFGRLNYTYKDKYLLTASARDDASSRFAKQNRWVVFPAVAVGWNISKESFLAPVSFLSDLKLRGSYGVTGQQDIGYNPYPYLALYQTSTATAQYQFGNSFNYTNRPNAYDVNIKWETTNTADLGLDFGILGNKISGTVDVYERKTKNLINSIPIAAGSNFSNYLTTNVGSLQNRGIELTLRATPIKTDNFEWNAGFNFTHNENKVTKLLKTDDPTYPGLLVGSISGGVGNTVQNIQVGSPVNSFYVLQQVYNTQGKPVEGLYVDRTGKGGDVTASTLNRYHDHKPLPNFLMGINSRFNYKKFDFSFSGRVSLGNYVYNNLQSNNARYSNFYYSSQGYFSNLPKSINDTKFANAQYLSDYYVQNASFFKMDFMSLGYNFTKLMTQKLKGRVGFTVQNAFFITKYKGIDPEVDGGIDNNIYPRPRVFMLSLNLTY